MGNIPLQGQDIDKVIDMFVEENVLLYHGISPQMKPEYSLTEKVDHSFKHKETKRLSTLTVRENESTIMWAEQGLIVKPTRVLCCDVEDVGYTPENSESYCERHTMNPTIEMCKMSIQKRGVESHNEFLIEGYEILTIGVFNRFVGTNNAKEVIEAAKKFDINRLIIFNDGFEENGSTIQASDIYY